MKGNPPLRPPSKKRQRRLGAPPPPGWAGGSPPVVAPPAPRVAQRAPAASKNFAYQRKRGARDSDDARCRHQHAVQGGPDFRRSSFGAAPVNETNDRHQKKRLGIRGDEKERRRMRQDRQCAKKTER